MRKAVIRKIIDVVKIMLWQHSNTMPHTINPDKDKNSTRTKIKIQHVNHRPENQDFPTNSEVRNSPEFIFAQSSIIIRQQK